MTTKLLITILFMGCLFMLLDGCVQSSRVVDPPPQGLMSCESVPLAPEPPKAPRTTEQLAEYANSMRSAYLAAVKARDDCADKLNRLNSWAGTSVR